MTINEVISQFDNLKPNQYGDEQKMKWLSDLDTWLYKHVYLNHETLSETEISLPYESTEENLLIPDEYSELYINCLSYKVDFYNGEYDRYNNSAIVYNTQLQDFRNYINRTYLPKQKNKINMG